MKFIEAIRTYYRGKTRRYYPSAADSFHVRFCQHRTPAGMYINEPIKYLKIQACKTGGHTLLAVTESGAVAELDPARPGKEALWVVFNKLRKM